MSPEEREAKRSSPAMVARELREAFNVVRSARDSTFRSEALSRLAFWVSVVELQANASQPRKERVA